MSTPIEDRIMQLQQKQIELDAYCFGLLDAIPTNEIRRSAEYREAQRLRARIANLRERQAG